MLGEVLQLSTTLLCSSLALMQTRTSLLLFMVSLPLVITRLAGAEQRETFWYNYSFRS